MGQKDSRGEVKQGEKDDTRNNIWYLFWHNCENATTCYMIQMSLQVYLSRSKIMSGILHVNVQYGLAIWLMTTLRLLPTPAQKAPYTSLYSPTLRTRGRPRSVSCANYMSPLAVALAARVS